MPKNVNLDKKKREKKNARRQHWRERNNTKTSLAIKKIYISQRNRVSVNFWFHCLCFVACSNAFFLISFSYKEMVILFTWRLSSVNDHCHMLLDSFFEKDGHNLMPQNDTQCSSISLTSLNYKMDTPWLNLSYYKQ